MRIPSLMLAFAFFALGGWLFYSVPRFAEIYSDLFSEDVTLPVLTQFILNMAPWGWGILCGGCALLVLGKDLAAPLRKFPLWPFFIALLLVIGFVAVALFLPLTVIYEEL